MIFPTESLTLPNGLTFPKREVRPQAWQYHVMKHPFGFNRDRSLNPKKVGDPERWSETVPAVVEPGWRDATLPRIASLNFNGRGCELPEVHQRRVGTEAGTAHQCFDCPLRLAQACENAAATEPRPVGARYAAAAQQLLAVLSEGTAVPVVQLLSAIYRNARGKDLAQLSMLLVMRDRKASCRQIARAVRGDGLVVDFSLTGSSGEWRTTFRAPPGGQGAVASLFVQEIGSAMSDSCVVERLWWRNHGQH